MAPSCSIAEALELCYPGFGEATVVRSWWLMAAARGEERVLLVEFLSHDPLDQHGSEYYPFVQGRIRRRGGLCEWVVLAAGLDVRPNHPYEIELPEQRLVRLVEAIVRFQPGTIVLNERLGASGIARLREVAGSADIINPPEGRPWLTDTRDPSPEYDSQRLDPENPTADHFHHVVVDPRCPYQATVRRNPVFAGIDVDALENQFGCSFCPQGRERKQIPRPREALALTELQFVAYHETVREATRRHRFLLFTMPMLTLIDELAARLVEIGLPPAELHVTCRVDVFLGMAAALERALPLFRKAGHELHVWQVGLENYSPLENLRLNKGITVAQADRFVEIADRLEAEWPETFFFRAHGGFSMITFTPWTTVGDLRANIEGMRRHRLVEAGGFLVSNRLILRRETPIAALAERDGLILDPECSETRVFGLLCIVHWGEEELPWRFACDDVDSIYRWTVALLGRRDPMFPPRDPETAARLRAVDLRDIPSGTCLLELVVDAHAEATEDLDVLRYVVSKTRAQRAYSLLLGEEPGGEALDRRPSDPMERIRRLLPPAPRVRELLMEAARANPDGSVREMIRYVLTKPSR